MVQRRSAKLIFFVGVGMVSQKQLDNFLAAVVRDGQEQRGVLLSVFKIWVGLVFQEQSGCALVVPAGCQVQWRIPIHIHVQLSSILQEQLQNVVIPRQNGEMQRGSRAGTYSNFFKV